MVTQSQTHSSFVSVFPQLPRESAVSIGSLFPGRVFRRWVPKSHANLSFNIYEYLPPATKNLIISCFFPHPVLEYTWLLLNARWRHYNLNTRQPGLLNCHFNLNDIASSVHFRLHARVFTKPGSTYDGWEKVKRTSFCY